MPPRDRDYAPKGERRPPVKKRKGGGGSQLPGWVWLIAGLSIGMAVAAFYYIGRPMKTREPVVAEQAEAAPADTKGGKADKNGKKKEVEIPAKEKPRFTFYEILPNQEMVVPRETLTPKPQPQIPGQAPPPAVPDTGEVYFIQVASYRDENEAKKQKAALALLGAEAKIEKVTIDNKDTYYRVRIGPEKSLAHVQDLMARLEDNGIKAMPVKIKN